MRNSKDLTIRMVSVARVLGIASFVRTSVSVDIVASVVVGGVLSASRAAIMQN